MVLQNYWSWLRNVWRNVVPAASDITGVTGLYFMDGTAVTTLWAKTSYQNVIYNIVLTRGTNMETTGNISLSVGSGTTEVAATDIALATDETSNFAITGSIDVNYASNKMEIIFSCSATNTTATDITITEIGIKKPLTSDYNSYSLQGYILLTREVLDTPITIAAGETKTINYVWTMT